MARWVPLLLMTGGCLWIGQDEHDGRKEALAPEFELVTLNPERWSTCAGTPTFSVAANVAGRHAGASFEAWYQFDGDVQRTVGPVVAAAEIQGQATVTWQFEPDPAVTVFDDCDGDCETELTVGVSRLGGDDFDSRTIAIVGDANPTLAGGALVGPGAQEPLTAIEGLLQPNPTDSLSTTTWPTLAVVIADPVIESGLGATVRIASCPDGIDPTVQPASCTIVDATPSELELDEGPAWEVSTTTFGDVGCADPDLRSRVFVLIEDHPCGGPYALPVSPVAFRFVGEDCDLDGYTVLDGDCDDDDPSANPGMYETWYNGVDEDCDGADDFDQDGDGVASDQHGGTDCDDTNDAVYPDATEVCDDADNDCDGYTLEDQVTVFTSVGPPIVETDLQSALNIALAGDTVQVCPGTFSGNFTVDKDVEIIGSGSAFSTLESTGSNASVLTVTNGAAITLEGFTITGATDTGGGNLGGGVDASAAGALVGLDLLITSNAAETGGGMALAGLVTLEDVTVDGNFATTGGGLVVLPGGDVTMTNVIVQGNVASGDGGGMSVDSGTVVMDAASQIRQNTATATGGGVLAIDNADITGGLIDDNSANQGGGVAIAPGGAGMPVTVLDGVTISNNTRGITQGGGIHLAEPLPELYIVDATIEGNAASSDGGGLYARSVSASEAFVLTETTTFRNNDAAIAGGGTYARNTLFWAFDTIYEGNSAETGAGLHVDTSTFSIFTGTADGNVAGGSGGGVYLVDGIMWNFAYYLYGTVDLLNNTARDGAGAYIDNADFVNGDLTASNNNAQVDGGAFYITGNNGHIGMWGAGAVTGNTSQGNESDGVFVDEGYFRSCSTINFTDTVENVSGPQGVPGDPCFELFVSNIDEGTCSYCP